MDVHATLDAPVPPAELFAWVDDLARYAEWLDIVPRATPADPAPGDPGPAWLVDLRGRLGPFARSKRLRMVRVEHDPPGRAAFERRELDGRAHATWRLSADVTGGVTAADSGCRLAMHLHYGGNLWGPVVERLLRDEIERSKPRLLRLVTSRRG